MPIGYVGLGSMGGALAERLQLSHHLQVFDASPRAVERLAGLGASVAQSLPHLADSCDIIFLCLPTSRHVRQVIFSPDGLVDSLKPGTIIVDQTTGDPNESRQMAAELAKRQVGFIDAPVSGGIAGARSGTIAIMVGAEQTLFSHLLPLLQSISPNVFHAGGVGNGHVIKIVNNLLSTAQRLLSFEALALAAKNGVEPSTALEILAAGGGKNAYLERTMGPRILQGKLNVGFTLGLAHKDARLACNLGADSGVPLFFANIARELYQMCIADYGDQAQVDTVGFFYDRLAGTKVVPTETDLPNHSAVPRQPG